MSTTKSTPDHYRLVENGAIVDELRCAMDDASGALSNFPDLLKCIIRDERWKKFKTKLNTEATNSSFEEFVVRLPLEGLGTSMKIVRNLIRDDPEAMELLDRALERPTGKAGHNVDNVNVKETEERPDGNSAQQAIRKLRKDRPDLLERVKAKKLTPHAAMIEAGFRVRSFSVPDDPKAAAKRLAGNFKGERLAELIAELQKYAC